jgi:hypothetical protein
MTRRRQPQLLLASPRCPKSCPAAKGPASLFRFLEPPKLHLVNFRCHRGRPLHRHFVGLGRASDFFPKRLGYLMAS